MEESVQPTEDPEVLQQEVPADPIINPLPLSIIKEKIGKPLFQWFFIVSLIFWILVFLGISVKFSEEGEAKWKPIFNYGAYNEKFFSMRIFFIVWVLLFFMGAVGSFLLFDPYKGNNQLTQFLRSNSLSIFMILSVICLIFYIFLTGGLLDSPFTSVLSVYIGSFIIMQERTDTTKLSNGLIWLIIILICVPYAGIYVIDRICYLTNDSPINFSLSFLKWTESNGVTLSRFLVTALLTAYSIWQADAINKEINQTYQYQDETTT